MQEHSKLWYLENFNLLQNLSSKEKEALYRLTKIFHSPKNQILYLPSDFCNSIYLLKAGKVKISKISHGKEIILSIHRPGEIFGEMAIVGQKEREELAKVIDDAIICVVDKEGLQKMMQENPKFHMEILKFVGCRLKKVQSRMESLIFKSAEQRIGSFVKEITDLYGRIILGTFNNEWEVKLDLTHNEIAKITATSRQTVSATMCDLEKKGIIAFDRKRIKIKDYKKLSQMLINFLPFFIF